MSDPKPASANEVENVENETAAAEEQTANPFVVEDEQDLEGSLENIDLDVDEEGEADGEEAEAAEGEEDEEAEGDEEYEGDLEFDEDGNPVEDAC